MRAVEIAERPVAPAPALELAPAPPRAAMCAVQDVANDSPSFSGMADYWRVKTQYSESKSTKGKGTSLSPHDTVFQLFYLESTFKILLPQSPFSMMLLRKRCVLHKVNYILYALLSSKFAMAHSEVLCSDRLELGEGATWTGSSWVWIDILGSALYITADGSSSPRKIPLPSGACGTVIPRRGGRELIAALRHTLAIVDIASGEVTEFTAPASDAVPGDRDWRFNDGKAGPDGRVWVGTMGQPKPDAAIGTLFRVDPALPASGGPGAAAESAGASGSGAEPSTPTMHPVLHKLTISNGIAWSPDSKIMYHTDTPTATITAYDYDTATGSISKGRAAVKIADPERDGWPDGCTTDADGNLWVACWGGSRVVQFNSATGAVMQTIRLPVTRVSSCAFGGSDLTDLLVTTAQEGMSEAERAAEPQAGMTFIVRGAGKGLAPAYEYNG